MKTGYPLSLRNERRLPPHYSGAVCVWDIDKTYLSTGFSSFRGLARVPVEFSIDKRSIPGMPEVLRGLRRGPGEQVACTPLYFISASPPFLRGSIEGKMLRDGVEQDGITFKDWIRTLLELRPDRLFEQLGFKLAALLCGRMERLQAREYLFGDDYEKDALAYSLYARWVDGGLNRGEWMDSLAAGGVAESDRAQLTELAEKIPKQRGKIEKIYIHLEKNSPPQDFEKYGSKLVTVKGAYQMALALFEENLLDAACVGAVRTAVSSVPKYRYGRIKEMAEDALDRKLISRRKYRELEKP